MNNKDMFNNYGYPMYQMNPNMMFQPQAQSNPLFDINNRINRLEKQMNNLNQRLTKLENNSSNTNNFNEPDNNLYML